MLNPILKEKYILRNGIEKEKKTTDSKEETEEDFQKRIKAYLELKKRYEEAKNNTEEKEKILNEQKSRVIYCEVTPSSINNKYTGESERNVAVLFESANSLSRERYSAVFLFFDEGDVFFEERSSGTGSSNGNVKSELLKKIGVMPENEYLPVFVYCATNRANVFDAAFKRRFGNQNYFGLPLANERREFIKLLFDEYVDEKENTIDEKTLDLMVDLTKNKSQAYISSQMKEFYITGDDFRVTGFRLLDFINHLNKNKDNKGLE